MRRDYSDLNLDYIVGQLRNQRRAASESLTADNTANATAEDGSVAVYLDGELVPLKLEGAANEIALSSGTNTLTIQFAAGFILKGKNTPTLARAALEAAERATPAIAAVTLPLAKITPGGGDGSLTINTEGIVTAYVPPT